ncbi:FecR domain-containing protein [Parasphingorhabdus sp.]|uniref:FecR family protein n=1 Tax=Parasphingorhabdus sp. TaxID=2709688 RepID=UPI0032670266
MKKQTISISEPNIKHARSDLGERAQYWIVRLASKEMDKPELEQLEAWLAEDESHAHAFARERALWQDLDVAADSPNEGKASTPNVRSTAWQRRPRLSRRRLARVVPLALAASVFALFLGPTLLIEMQSDFRTAAGETRNIALSDGSTVVLDSATAIAVDLEEDIRVVRLLEGRAWFEVQHESRPFLVEAMNGLTRDIGTAFEVQRAEDTVQVSVTEGAVEVQGQAADVALPLKAGERARYTDTGVVPLSSRPVAALASWRNGELMLDQQRVDDAIHQIARYRAAPVWLFGDFDALPAVSGVFLISRPDEALETIAGMRDLQLVELPGGAVLIRPM